MPTGSESLENFLPVSALLNSLTPAAAFFEFGTLAADGMYEEYGGCPAAGVITGIGYVSGRQCVIVANDATVKAGAWFPMAGKKKLRGREKSFANRPSTIFFGSTGRGFLPLPGGTIS